VDVETRQTEIEQWEGLPESEKSSVVQPLPLAVGETFQKSFKTPRESIFWTHGLKMNESGSLVGSGRLNPELWLLDQIGFDLAKNPYALNESIRMSVRTVLPFLILMIVSLCTKPMEKMWLDRFYVKMKTPVHDDREQDLREIELSYQNPGRFDHRKMFPNTQWEFEKFTKTDLKGIAFFSFGAVLICLCLYGIALLGR
jgi:SSS family solute:Na+ symporter